MPEEFELNKETSETQQDEELSEQQPNVSEDTGGKPSRQSASLELALDTLPTGTQEEFEKNWPKGYLPDGVTSKRMYKDIARIAWPSLVEMILVQLASMADMMMVGSLGESAIAAVGLATQPKFILMSFFMSVPIGSMAMIARFKGMGDQKRANLAMRQSLLLSFSICLVMIAIGIFSARWMIGFMANVGEGAMSQTALDEAYSYLIVQIIGMPTIAIGMTITACLRGVGSTRIAMVYNLVSNVVNIFFNYCMIGGNFGFPAWGVFGASVATVIGQCVSMCMAIAVVMGGRHYLKLKLSDGFVPHLDTLLDIVKIGLPALLEQLVMRIGNLFYNRTIASLGDTSYAAHNIVMNIQSMSFTMGMAISSPATSLVGQSLGKKRSDMAVAYSSRCRRVSIAISFVIAFLFVVFGQPLIRLYNDAPAVVAAGYSILLLCALIVPFQSSQFVVAGILRGAGDTLTTALIIATTTMLIRPILASIFVINFGWGLQGAWYALFTDQLLRSLLIVMRYNTGKWKYIFKPTVRAES